MALPGLLRDYRKTFQVIETRTANMSLKNLSNRGIDMDVFLQSIGKNLQREFVWTLDQQKELIKSFIIGRAIPAITIINLEYKVNNCSFQVIDGKQRLTSFFNFVNNKFSVELDGVEYYYNDLPNYWKVSIMNMDNIIFMEAVENFGGNGTFTDQHKIDMFKFINFAGTPQDQEHIDSLK